MANRQALDDGSGWFDLDLAQRFVEKTFHDGSNNISANTGSQWDHQQLFRTAKGRYVLHCWSDFEGTRESWQAIDDTDAHKWLIRNEHFASVPEVVLEGREV